MMNNADKSYHFGFEDFVRYHQGKMSAAEMHLLEKAALEDSFLQDALDGYALSANPEKEVNDIQLKLGQKADKQNKGLLIIFKKHQNSFGIAASLLVIAFTGYFILGKNINSTNNENPLIAKNEPKPKQQSEISVDKEAVSATSGSEVVVADHKSSQRIDVFKITPKKIDENISPSKLQTSESIVLDEKPSATLNVNKDLSVAYATTAQAEDDQMKKSNLETDSKIEVSQPAVAMSSTVVEKTKSFNEEDVSDEQKTFQSYVVKNKKEIKDDIGNVISGKVVLNFDTDKKGNPVNIKVTTSLCNECDKEAVRLLKSGPKWKLKNANNQTSFVEF